jgi:beta-1,2-mannobiose phosphorylase / 1,2-beta-oligomannan phosphorylase
MIKIKKEGILLQKTQYEFENEGVFNPAAIRQGDSVHLLYRAVRKGNYSTLGYCRLDGPLTVAERWNKPFMISGFDYESHGVEDARIVQIENEFHLTYTGYDGTNARGALATSNDLMHFEKKGLITPPVSYAEFVAIAELNKNVHEDYCHNHAFYYQENDPERKIMLWDKDVIFFPRRIDGKLVFLHRIRPGIQIVAVDSMEEITRDFWESYFLNLHDHIVLDPVYPHESSYIGGGCPPIETEYGWLIIYHGVKQASQGLVYSACAALLDLNNPSRELARLPYPLFFPEYEWEMKGEVNNVVFPTGTAQFGATLFIYYGAADAYVACASVNLSDLVSELLNYTTKE